MKNLTRNFISIGIMMILLAACGQHEATPASTAQPDVPVIGKSTQGAESEQELPKTVSGNFSQYIGLNYPPLPAGLLEEVGMLIQDADDHSLSLISDGEHKMLWFSKMTHRDSDGVAYWEVRDVLVLSNLEAGLVLLPDGCVLNGVPDSEIIAAGKEGILRWAWRANTSLDKFESIPVDGIACNTDKAMNIP